MSGSGTHSGSGVGDAVRKGVGLVHGTGEAIRGNINAAVDSATGDYEAAARNQNIASRGADEMVHGHYHGTGADVTPVDTGHERANRAVQGESALPGSTNYGPHATNVGNKLDPRYDSDVDHRGTVQGSTNFGPHGTNVGNKLDPTVDSDQGHRAAPAQYDGPSSTNYGPHSTNAANKLDTDFDSDLDHRGTTQDSTNYGPHHTNIANTIDPRIDSDYDHRAHHVQKKYPDGTHSTGYGDHESTNHGPHHTNAANKLDPTVNSDQDHRVSHGPTNYGPHSAHVANKLDSRYDSDLDHRGPGSTNFRSTSHEDLSRTGTLDALQRADTMPHLHHNCPPATYEEINDNGRYSRRSSKGQHAPRKSISLPYQIPCPVKIHVVDSLLELIVYSSRAGLYGLRLDLSHIANLLDPRVGAVAPVREPHSTANPHQRGFLNLMDPRVDGNTSKD